VGVVDAYRGRVARAIERTKGRAKAYASYPDLLADKSIDAVVIATPDHWHGRMVLDALHAAKTSTARSRSLSAAPKESRSPPPPAPPAASSRWAATA